MGSLDSLILQKLRLCFVLWSYGNVYCDATGYIWQEGSVSFDAALAGLIKTEKVRSPVECVVSCYGDQLCVSIGFTEPDECSLLSVDVAVVTNSTAQQPTKYFGRNFCVRDDYTYNSSLNVCFKINYYDEDFSGARKICQAEGGDLLTVRSLDMEVYLRPMLDEHPSAVRYWVGATQAPGLANNWTWIDGTDVMSELWRPTEPNNVKEQCAELIKLGGVYVMRDVMCNDAIRFICEIS